MIDNSRFDQVRDPWVLKNRADTGPATDHPDWQQRTISELVTGIWQGDDDDHGAMTRFGMGWGPIEVVRASRFVKNDNGPRVYRLLEIWGGGKCRLTVKFSETGRSYTAVDARTGDVMAPRGGGLEPAAAAAVQELGAALRATPVDQLTPQVMRAWDALRSFL